MFKYKTSLVLFLLLISGLTLAAPAAWFQWRSKLNSVLVCSQTSLGEGWEKVSAPYLDARCKKLKTLPPALTRL
jgi:hypothetical protein